MRSAFAPLAFAALAAAAPQNSAPGATDLKPSEASPAGCQASYNGNFVFSTVNTTSNAKRSLVARQSGFTLKDGIFRDSQNRVGSIVANNQFQFDPENGQAGAIYNAGWSVCPNGTIALGGSTIFQNCLSGDFYNIYRGNSAPQCHDVYLVIAGASTGATTTGNGGTGQQADGQPTGGAGASQISDGQVQVPMATQMPDGQVIEPVSASQIADGQVQAPTGTASQIADGQVQAPTASQIADGQVQAPTASQIADGQVQAPTATASQIADGQVQAPVPSSAAGNASASATPATYTGAGAAIRGDLFALAGASLMAVLLL